MKATQTPNLIENTETGSATFLIVKSQNGVLSTEMIVCQGLLKPKHEHRTQTLPSWALFHSNANPFHTRIWA